MNQIDLAVSHALSEYRLAQSRSNLAPGGGLDGKRPQAWCEYGFPETLSFGDFYSLYRRGGVAHGAVNKLVGTCWKTLPWLIEGDEEDESRGETAWERKAKQLQRNGAFWREVREADRRRLVGRYSALILHYSDVRTDADWAKPTAGGQRFLTKMTPAWETAIKANERDSFGEPVMWQYAPTHGGYIRIHPDRVFILGDTTPDAIGFLEPAYNNFVSMEKVTGGSGESFLKNAARQLSVSFDKEVNLGDIARLYGVSLDELHAKFNDAARDINRGNDVMLINQGADVNPLVSDVPDPRPTFDINLQEASAALDIPSRVLVGNQQGERASSEDNRYFNGRCQSRRRELSVEIGELLRKLMEARALEAAPEFEVMWDDLAESSSSDKLANAKTMAEINQTALGTGTTIFEDDEIRTEAGYSPLDLEDPLPDEEIEEDGEV